MVKFKCDGAELEIDDSGSVSIIQNWLKTRDDKIASLTNKLESYSFDGKKFKFGEDMKEYEDMEGMYKDMKSFYDDMCSYKKKYEDMQGKKDTADAKADALQAELDKRNDSKDIDLVALVKTRRDLERIATVNMKDFSLEKFDSMDDLAVKQAIVKDNGFDPDKYSEDSLGAIIDVIVQNNEKRQDNYQSQIQTFVTPARIEKNVNSDSLYDWCDEAVTAVENAWKQEVK